MKVAILTANLGSFDTPIDPVEQDLPKEKIAFHRFTDENFPPITGLTPRLQYRIPKLFGWEMFPGYDAYLWLDGSFSLTRPDSLEWFLEQLGDADAAFFKHPQRNSIAAEASYIEDKLQQGNKYMIPRYKNGLHKEQLEEAYMDDTFKDDVLYTSTAFIYRNNEEVRDMMHIWWFYQSRYFTCDQVALPFAIHRSRIKVNKIDVDQYKTPYMELVSRHK